jgi:hypothetical protein
MVASTNAATDANPSQLPARYEIRQLTTPEHTEWARAIICHSNGFHSPVWAVLHPGWRRADIMVFFDSCAYLMEHQVASGFSYGVFDTQYAFKRAESAAAGGKLYWRDNVDDHDAGADEMLAEMDFPLVSVAMAYDGINPFDMARLGDVIKVLPQFGIALNHLTEMDKRDKDAWEPKAPGEVLLRASTCTRPDYEGQGLMAKTARWLMREAAAKGFRGIQIETMHDAVRKVWANPPPPFKAEVVSSFMTNEFETVGEDGEKKNPFIPTAQEAAKIYVTL